MALFKIEKGQSKNLYKNRPNANEGFAYFTTDDGKFHIDIAGDGSTTPATSENRITLNADTADRVRHSLTIGKFRFDGSEDVVIGEYDGVYYWHAEDIKL